MTSKWKKKRKEEKFKDGEIQSNQAEKKGKSREYN